MTDDFRGFSDQTVAFLGDLRNNNDKAWFDANRGRWDDHAMVEARAFVEAAGQALQEIAPDVRAEPKVNGSIFRINRDTRFSKDKAPYKDHLDFWFWEGVERRRAVTGYFLRITPDGVGVGVGAHGFDPDQLVRYRGLVVAPGPGRALREAVGVVEKAGFPVHGEHYRRVPKGFAEPEDPLASRLLRCNALWTGEDLEAPRTLGSARFVSWCLTRWRKQQPLHGWLRDHLQ